MRKICVLIPRKLRGWILQVNDRRRTFGKLRTGADKRSSPQANGAALRQTELIHIRQRADWRFWPVSFDPMAAKRILQAPVRRLECLLKPLRVFRLQCLLLVCRYPALLEKSIGAESARWEWVRGRMQVRTGDPIVYSYQLQTCAEVLRVAYGEPTVDHLLCSRHIFGTGGIGQLKSCVVAPTAA